MDAKTISTIAAAALLGGGIGYLSLPEPEQRVSCMLLTFDNLNDQTVSAVIESSTNLLNWRTETNFLAKVGENEWRDYDVNQPVKFYRVGFDWWY